MFVVGALVCLAGMFCVALTQSKQAKLLIGKAPQGRARTTIQWSGVGLLAVSAVLAVERYGLGVGLTTFLAWCCIAAWLIALVVTARR